MKNWEQYKATHKVNIPLWQRVKLLFMNNLILGINFKYKTSRDISLSDVYVRIGGKI